MRSRKKTGSARALLLDDEEWAFLALAVRYAHAEVELDVKETGRALDAWAEQCSTMSSDKIVRCFNRVYGQGRKALDRLDQGDMFTTATRRWPSEKETKTEAAVEVATQEKRAAVHAGASG